MYCKYTFNFKNIQRNYDVYAISKTHTYSSYPGDSRSVNVVLDHSHREPDVKLLVWNISCMPNMDCFHFEWLCLWTWTRHTGLIAFLSPNNHPSNSKTTWFQWLEVICQAFTMAKASGKRACDAECMEVDGKPASGIGITGSIHW